METAADRFPHKILNARVTMWGQTLGVTYDRGHQRRNTGNTFKACRCMRPKYQPWGYTDAGHRPGLLASHTMIQFITRHIKQMYQC